MAAASIGIALTAVPADAQEDLYAKVSGVFVAENIDGKQTVEKFSGPVQVDFDESWGIQAALGRKMTDTLSAEIQFEYLVPVEVETFGSGNSGDLQVVNGTINAKLACPAWKRISPYLIAGAGLMKAYEDISYGGLGSKTNDWGPSVRAGGGIDVTGYALYSTSTMV